MDDGSRILTEDVWFGQDIAEDNDPVKKTDLSSIQQPDDMLG